MSIFFSMVDGGAGPQAAFFMRKNHAPEGALEISESVHKKLFEAQSEGAVIAANANGKPIARFPPAPKLIQLRADLIASTKGEAAARIQSISPPWRQMNDMRAPSAAGYRRFAAIDAIREASARIEEQILSIRMTAIAKAFPVKIHPLWPEIE